MNEIQNATANIMVVSDRNYLGQMKIMLFSLFDTNPRPIRVFLFHNQLTEDDLKSLSDFAGQWPEKEIVPVCLEDSVLDGLPTSETFPKEVYFKFLALNSFLPEVKKILCMDLDMIVTKPLDVLFDLDMGRMPLAACMDIYGYVYGESEQNIRRLGLHEDHIYFNSGLICYNLDVLRGTQIVERLLETARKHRDYLKWWEQDVLNLCFEKNYGILPWQFFNCPPIRYVMRTEEVQKGTFKPLGINEIESTDLSGFADYTEAVRDMAAVIHFIGETKPWKKDRQASETYRIFDMAYEKVITQMNPLP